MKILATWSVPAYSSVVKTIIIIIIIITQWAGSQWLTPVVLATQEAEIRKTAVQSQPGQFVQETSSQKKKNPSQKRAGGMA
jgi:hypothetical protein